MVCPPPLPPPPYQSDCYGRFDPDTRAKINILPNDKTTSYRRLTEAIDPANIPKYYGGQLDWDFPDSPNLDPEINKMLGFTADDWPVGPAMLQGDDLVAVGKMKDGALRRTVVGRCGGAGAA
jgi:hypothetical protein